MILTALAQSRTRPAQSPYTDRRAGRSVIRREGRDPIWTGLVQAVEDTARQALAGSTTPGLAVALVHQGQLVWAAGYGLIDRASGHPVTATTRFQAASLSKPWAERIDGTSSVQVARMARAHG
jgi:CubicO group peptidase (beta-lactamase class C family)